MTLLTSPEVCRATGATYRQLDYWTTHGWLLPTTAMNREVVPQTVRVGESLEDALRSPGSGNVRYWGEVEVKVIRRMVLLVRDGLTPPCAARVARALAESGTAHLSVGTVVEEAGL